MISYKIANQNLFTIPRKKIVFCVLLAIISGGSGFLFIAFTNKIIGAVIASKFPEENNVYLIFSIIILFFVISKRILSEEIINISQDIYWDLRGSVIRLILNAPYSKTSKNREEFYSALTSDIQNLTQAAVMGIELISSSVIIIGIFTYMVFLSWKLSLLTFIIIGGGVLVYIFNSRIANKNFKAARELENYFVKLFNGFLNGSKELKINCDKGERTFKVDLVPILNRGKEINTKAFISYLNSQIINQFLFYSLIALIFTVFLIEYNYSREVIISFIFTLMFSLGPISSIILSIPTINKAKISLNKITVLAENLEEHIPNNRHASSKIATGLQEFQSFLVEQLYFKYDSGFEIGPIDFYIRKNEIIFIHGGNGSGKTTFIHNFISLYDKVSGTFYINGEKIPKNYIKDLRRLFSPVFSDFYIFETLNYENIDSQSKVQEYLKVFELLGKVEIVNDKILTRELSTGQRKRLALIIALLEQRPIIVLDEWAADQDPVFRKKFYKEILPWLVGAENRTILAITHDDAYFNSADRLFKMENGKLFEINKDKSFANNL